MSFQHLKSFCNNKDTKIHCLVLTKQYSFSAQNKNTKEGKQLATYYNHKKMRKSLNALKQVSIFFNRNIYL